MNSLKILALSGSQRNNSFNRMLVENAARGAGNAGASITFLNWADYTMPLYDPDIESHGLPDTVLRFKAALISHQGLLISSPEYNGSLTPLLKNAIDWATRPIPGEKPMSCFKNKIVGLMSTSPGVFGGVVGLAQLRAILTRLGCVVVPEQYPVGESGKIFDEEGSLRDPKQRAIAEGIGARVVEVMKSWPIAQVS